MQARFELTHQDGLYTFNLISGDGSKLLIGGEYDNKADVEKAIQDVKVGTLVSQQIAAGKIKTGDTFFVIKDSAGNIIAKSVLFSDAMLFDNALHAVKDNACVAEVSDLCQA